MNDPRQPLPGGAARPVLRPAPPAALQQQPSAAGGQGGMAKIAGMPTLHAQSPARDDSSIELIDDGETAEEVHQKIKAFGPESASKQSKWTRPTVCTNQGPARVRTFHAKLSDLGMEYLDDSINRFLDEHPEVDIKFVTTNIGMFDGKFKDLALIINVWY